MSGTQERRKLEIDYYFSVLSDWAYMGGERLEALALRYRARIHYKPMKLAQVYAGTGGTILQKRSRQRQDYRVVELERWRDRLGIPITLHPKFYPTDDTPAACLIIEAGRQGLDAGRLANLILRGIWAEEKDVSDEATLKRIAAIVCSDPQRLLERAKAPDALDTLERNTVEAQQRGVFGSPFYLIGDQIFWGQDRLDFVEAVLARGTGS